MKTNVFRRYFAFLLCLFVTSGVAAQFAPIPPLSAPVVDTTATLTVEQQEQLNEQALALSRNKGSQLQVLIVPSTEPEDIAAYSQRVFDQWELGRQGVDDGVLLVVAVEDRALRIQTGYGLEGAIPDATAKRVIQEYIIPKFRANDYAGGIIAGTERLKSLIEGEPLPSPVEIGYVPPQRTAQRTPQRTNHIPPWMFFFIVSVGGFSLSCIKRVWLYILIEKRKSILKPVMRGVSQDCFAGFVRFISYFGRVLFCLSFFF